MKYLLILTLSILSISSFANCDTKVNYISDFDDTIKTYRSEFPLFKLGNALWRKNVNAGMPELFRQLAEEQESCGHSLDFTVLTASLRLFRPSIRSFMKYYKLPKYRLIVRPISEKTLQYKKSRLYRLITQSENPVILIGDDTSYDAVAYVWAKKKFPKKVLQIYIHNVKGKKPVGDEHKYFSTWEIAVQEHLAGRLGLNSAILIGNKVLNSQMKDIIPKYGECPKKIENIDYNHPELNKINREINKKIISHCKSR